MPLKIAVKAAYVLSGCANLWRGEQLSVGLVLFPLKLQLSAAGTQPEHQRDDRRLNWPAISGLFYYY